MDAVKENGDQGFNEKECSPSPEPFKEPDGMVTIELDRHSPPPSLLSSSNSLKKENEHGMKYLSYISVIALLCLMSFAAAISLHWDDISWLSKNHQEAYENSSIHTAALLQVTESTIATDTGTCPVDPQEGYRIHLIICERTKTFKDCCHAHIRTTLPQINDVCSILELLDVLVEYKRLLLTRIPRNADVEYSKQDYEKEKEKMRTKEKILSYIRHLNKPLQKEIPALFDWFGDLFLEYQEEFEDNHDHTGSNYKHSTEKNELGVPVDLLPDTTEIEKEIDYLQLKHESNNRKTNVTKSLNPNDENEAEKEKNRTTSRDRNESNKTSIHFKEKLSGTEFIFPEEMKKARNNRKKRSDTNDRDRFNYAPYDNNDYPSYVNNEYNVDQIYETNRDAQSIPTDVESDFGQIQNIDTPLYNYYGEDDSFVGQAPDIEKVEPETTGYNSFIKNEPGEDELRLPIHTDERDFGRQNWKDLGLTILQESTIDPELPTESDVATEQTYSNGKLATTVAYIDDEESPASNRKSSGGGRRKNDKMMKFPYEVVRTTTRPHNSARNYVDVTDTIESIENIHGTNKSILIDIGNTKLTVSKADESKKHIHNSESTTVNEDTITAQDAAEMNSEHSRNAAPQTKGNSFQLVNEETQSIQNHLVNPNLCQYPPPLGSPNKFIMVPDNRPQVMSVMPPIGAPKQQVYVLNPSMLSYIPPAPVIPHYGPVPQQYNPYTYFNPLGAQSMAAGPMQMAAAGPMQMAAAGPLQMAATGPVQMTSSNGQMFLCNPALQSSNPPPTNTQTVEIRSSSNLQESFDDTPIVLQSSNKTRSSLNCPMDEQSCLDGSKCINLRHVCDNEVHCEDGSDETFCSCKERIAEFRLCDGYLDCPDGEDEQDCFGCSEDEINCDDWTRFRKGTCVPMSQKCDGIRQCEITGKDEDDCLVLTDHVGESNPMKISNAAGFIHRNYKGKWYPTCFGSEIWALEACKVEAGPSTKAPVSHMVPTSEKYEGQYINLLPNREVSLVSTCVPERASFVECPPLFCGLRLTIRNPYRAQEVDTSIEDMMTHLNRQDYTFGEDYDTSERDSTNRTRRSEDFVLGGQRVVGGRASQPAAWPWVVSIYKNGIFHCGGVIINELWILTAAHCITKYWLFYYEIQAGILRRFSYSPMEQVRWIVSVVAHEDYDKTNLKNDIALMKLSSALRYNRYVRPICLPSEITAGADFRRGPSPGTICTTVGWGATIEHGSDPDHMREVEVPVLKSCKHPEDIEGQELCAGLFEGGKDACQGDSGGPFMCQNPNNPSQWYLAGIVSHGEGCARPNEPGVYTRVSQYMSWIADNIREGNFFPRTPLQKCPGYTCRATNKCIPKKRHCDKVIDCLMGDDEMNCENRFQNIFKFSGDTGMSFFRAPAGVNSGQREKDGDILGATIIDADFENSTSPPISQEPAEEKIRPVLYHYEKKAYFNNNTDNPDYFRCDRLLQMVPIRKRCNKVMDCEDGTDEVGCRCVDYIKLSHPSSICDGEADCKDGTDESLCFACREGEFNCMRSRMCISRSLVCDGRHDCTKGEDESDCVALTDGKFLNLDAANRPNMTLAGVVSVNRFGIWRPYCNNSHSKADAAVATNTCNYLGFAEYTGFKKLKVMDRSLSVKNMKGDLISSSLGTANDSNSCDGLYVWCSYVSSHQSIQVIKNDENETYEATWNAAVFADGNYSCMGVILNEKWVITSMNCIHGILQANIVYIAVVVGKGTKYFDIPGPYEHIIGVADTFQVLDTDICLLWMEQSIPFNRYIQPTNLNVRIERTRKERCVAVGLKEGKTSIIFLDAKSKCSKEETCYSAATSKNCLDGPWSGVITCYDGNGWYPASVFSTTGKSCPFEKDANFTSVKFFATEIQKFTRRLTSPDQQSYCDGFRCNLGNCVGIDELCDGIPHCSGGEDETTYFCAMKKNACPIMKTCACPVDQMMCSNGNCVHKSKFCDRVNDCGDFSDEPPRCTCRSYLKLAHSKKVCDGHVNCFDGSDEDPRLCPCKPGNFVCTRSKYCVSNEMVCNGFEDCPDGEDENECLALARNDTSPPSSGEVLTRTAGQLTESCYSNSPPKSELDYICRKLGFVKSRSHRLLPTSETGNATLVPVTDTFNVVWIRREGRVPLLFRMRTGNDDYLTFRKQDNCHRLHIECIDR